MTTVLVPVAGLGLSVAALVWQLVPARPSLAVAIEALRRPPPTAVVGRQRLWRLLAAPLRHLRLPREQVGKDLAILERDLHRYLAGQLGWMLLGLLTPSASVAALDTMGAHIALSVPLMLGVALGGGAFALAEASVRDAANARRLLMVQTLVALLDVVPAALAAGAGIEQAMTDALKGAQGWAAERIRGALHTARDDRLPMWQPLRTLGTRIDVVDLVQLSGTLRLAAGEGTRIREALIHRGEALSERLTAQMEARAESATERMSVWLMALTALFLMFLIYPAIAALKG